MGLFTRSVPDQDWLREVTPLYEAASPLGAGLSQAILDEDIELQIEAVQQVLQKFPVIREGVRRSGTPISREAREAKKTLDLALKDYIDGAQQGAKLFRDLGGGLGERLSLGGFAGRAAAGRTTFQQTFFSEIVKKAEKRMNDAALYFSKQNEPSALSRQVGSIARGVSFGSLIQRIFGGGIPAERREAVLAYLGQEWRLQALQDAEGGRYNDVLTKYGGGAIQGSEGVSEIVSAGKRQSQLYATLSRDHGELSPVPDDAGACYFKWQETYMRLQEWASAMVAAYEGFEAGASPHVGRLQQLQAAEQRAEQAARKEELKLLRRLEVSAEEYQRLFQQAGAAANALPQERTATSSSEAAMRFCPNCGKQEVPDQSFCPYCGTAR